MAQLESLICEACRVGHETILFDDDKCRPISGSCGHSACEVCVELDPKRKCPICFRREAFVKKTINYGALGFRAEYERNVFEVIRKWWKMFISNALCIQAELIAYGSSDFGKEAPSYGYCAKCGECTSLKICLTCRFSRNYVGMDVVGYAVCDDCALKEYNNQNMEDVRQHGDVKNAKIACHICETLIENPKFHGPLLNRKMDNPDSRFLFCSTCVLEDHQDHSISLKKLFDGWEQHESITKTATGIMDKLLRKKLEVDEDKIKCRLRYKRMMLTSSELLKIVNDLGAVNEEAILNKNSELEGTFSKTLESLETQFEQFQQLRSVCKCVTIWDRIVKLEIFDSKGRSPHFHSMADKADLEKKIDVCPYDLKSSGPEKRSLLEIIRKGEILIAPFKMEIRREVRRCRFRNVYHFPTRDDEIQKVSGYSVRVAHGRETGHKNILKPLMKREAGKLPRDGYNFRFRPDGTVDYEEVQP